MAGRARFEDWVPFPLEQVFLFFANPTNLPRLMPPATRTQIDDLKLVPPPAAPGLGVDLQKLAGAGTELASSFRVLPLFPFRATWVAAIDSFEWNQYFSDLQKKGPFKRWHHRHEFNAEERNGIVGTVVRDVIGYDAGFGILGRVAEEFFIAPQLQRTFAYRQRILSSLLREPTP